MTPLEHHALAPGVEVHLTGRDAASGSVAIDSEHNLAHHRPHVPSRLATARARIAEATGTDLDRWVTMRQVHGAIVATVEGRFGREIRGVDGLITRETDVALVVMAADCVPILLAGSSCIAAVHAGWRGLVAGIVPAAVARMRELDGADAAIGALVGPCIGACCYEVGADVLDAVGSRMPSAVTTSARGAPSVDLDRAVRATLDGLGVRIADRRPTCTRCSPGWFSHRADPASGRQVGIVVRRPPDDPRHSGGGARDVDGVRAAGSS